MNKIIAFSFAGGSKYSFQAFSVNVPGFRIIEYPGRGARAKEALIDDINLLIEDLLPAVIQEINSCREYILYGHSLGAFIAYCMCHHLTKRSIRLPSKLVVSGRKPPSIVREELFSRLPDIEFWDAVKSYGGIPEELYSTPEAVEYFLPILKNDFRVIEGFCFAQQPPLNIPIDAFYGTEEKIAPGDMQQWAAESKQEVVIKQLQGNHFFINNQRDFFIEYFKKSW